MDMDYGTSTKQVGCTWKTVSVDFDTSSSFYPTWSCNFMSLGRIVVDHTVHHDTSQHFHLQGSNFSGATGVNIGSGTNNTSISNTNTNAAGVNDSGWYDKLAG